MRTHLQIVWTALQLYWAVSVSPSLGPTAGGTLVTVAGLHLNAAGGNVYLMRCRFGAAWVQADYSLGLITCTR